MLGRMDPNFNPSSMVVPGIGGQGAFGSSGKAPSYMTTSNADIMGGGSMQQPSGVAGLQAQPLGVQQQLMQAMQQLQQQQNPMQTAQPIPRNNIPAGQQFAPSPRDQMSDRDRFIESQFQGNPDLPQAQLDAMRSQFGQAFDARGGQSQPALPRSTVPGVSSFVGASSNDIQRMLNRGSVATGGIDDAQRQMEQVRRDEFLAKMRAQNPERFNDMPSTPPMGGTPSTPPMRPMPSTSPMRPDVDIFSTPPPGVNPGLADGVPRQFPGFTPTSPSVFTPPPSPPSSVAGAAGGLGGIMDQAPSFMTQYMDMIRSPMQGYGGGGTQMSSAPAKPFGQIPMLPNQVPMQTYGSQNTAPIQSPFA